VCVVCDTVLMVVIIWGYWLCTSDTNGILDFWLVSGGVITAIVTVRVCLIGWSECRADLSLIEALNSYLWFYPIVTSDSTHSTVEWAHCCHLVEDNVKSSLKTVCIYSCQATKCAVFPYAYPKCAVYSRWQGIQYPIMQILIVIDELIYKDCFFVQVVFFFFFFFTLISSDSCTFI